MYLRGDPTFRGDSSRSYITTAYATLCASPHDWELNFRHYAHLVINIKQLQATEARDKVMGTTSILSGLGLVLPPLNYSMSVVDVFTVATRMWFRRTKSLRLLNLAATGRSISGLPSWVIDWSHGTIKDNDMVTSWVNVLHGHQPAVNNSDGSTQSGIWQDEQSRSYFDRRLGVRGIALEKVSHFIAGTCKCTHAQTHDHLITWLQFILDAHTPASLPDVVHQVVALFPTTHDTFDVPAHIAEAIILRKARLVERHLASIPHDKDKHAVTRSDIPGYVTLEETSTMPLAERRIELTTTYRLELKRQNETLFMSNAGRIGFCFCEDMQKGDVIAILVGADRPVILREMEEPGQYLFVGPATVYGMMNGEMWPKDLDELQDLILV